MDIELRSIHKRFGAVHANNDINLTFKGGRIIGVLGENGAGKSTLMKILSGFQAADSGQILMDGRAVDYHGPQAAIQHGVGMLQQDPLDIAAFTVLENFTYGGLRISRREAAAKLANISQRFGFQFDPDVLCSTLSIGQRQQLEIVRLLALGVKTLILDEPTTGISAEQKNLLFEALRHLAAEDGLTVLLVSHKLEDVVALCNEVAVLRAGRVVGTQQMPATTQDLVSLMFGYKSSTQTQLTPAAVFAPETPKSETPAAVRVENVTLRGKRLSVDNFSLDIRPGEIIGLAGLDGSGQELLLRACVGLVKPARGQIVVNGADLTGKSYGDFMRAGVAFGAAGRLEEGLVSGLTLTEHMALVTETGMLIDWQRAQALTETKLKQYDVRGTPKSAIQNLSGGNQQRLLMALMPEEPVLMALEQPTRGLDVDSARWIWRQLLNRRSTGTSIIFSSPDLDEVVMYSDRILVFYTGRVAEIPDAELTTIDEVGRMIGGDGVA